MNVKKMDQSSKNSSLPLKVYKSEEYLIEYRRDMTEKELTDLRDSEVVKKALKSSTWGVVAAAIKEKHMIVSQGNGREKRHTYIGWDGIKSEKESDRGKVGRIVSDQRDELESLKNMSLVKNTLKQELIAKEKAAKMFHKIMPAIHTKKRARNLIVSNRNVQNTSSSNKDMKKSVHTKSQVLVGTVFSVPSKRKRVLERLKSTQLAEISNAETRRSRFASKKEQTQHIDTHEKKEFRGKVLDRKMKTDSTTSEGSTIDATISDNENTHNNINNLTSNETFSKEYNPQLLACADIVNDSLEEKETIQTDSSHTLTFSKEDDPQLLACAGISLEEMSTSRRIQTDSSHSSMDSNFYTSQSSHTSQFSRGYSTASSVDSIDIMEQITNLDSSNRDIDIPLSHPLTDVTLYNEHDDDDDGIPTVPPLSSEAAPFFNRNSWSWLDSYKSRLAKTVSEGSMDSTSSQNSEQYLNHSIKSPDISDSAYNTPAATSSDHPLSNSNKAKCLPSCAFDDQNFVEYCKGLDHKPTHDDYVTYKLLIISDMIEEKYGKDIENAIREAFTIALKDKFSYIDFARISHRLALQAKYVQEQAFLITCLGRQLYEKLPDLQGTISTYTAKAIEEMATEFLLGLSWSGDNPRHNPEITWDYDDWSFLVNNQKIKDDIIAENFVPTEILVSLDESHHASHLLSLPVLRRISSVEVLIVDDEEDSPQATPTPFCDPPISRLVCRRHSLTLSPLDIVGCHSNSDMVDGVPPGGPTGQATDLIMEASNTQQVTEHLEKSRSLRSPFKPVVLSLSSVSSERSVFTTTITPNRLTSVASSTTSEHTNIIHEDSSTLDENYVNEGSNGTVNVSGRRHSSLQAISEVVTSPILTVGLPLAVLAALALGRS